MAVDPSWKRKMVSKEYTLGNPRHVEFKAFRLIVCLSPHSVCLSSLYLPLLCLLPLCLFPLSISTLFVDTVEVICITVKWRI